MLDRVDVVGAGLIGGSLALRLASLGRSVRVVDPDPETRARARAAGLVVADDVAPEADLVVIATPLDTLAETMAHVAASAPAAIVIDVGSVKQPAARAAASAGLGGRHVGAHPMAGTEHTGFEHADAELLVGATWAVARGGGTEETARVVDWLTTDLEATVVLLGAAEHDRAVALVSHAPHALAHALLATAEAAAQPTVAGLLAAGSFRDGTRVAGRNAARTFNMLSENAGALGPVLDEVIAELAALRADLANPEALRARLDRAAATDDVVRRPDPDFAACSSLTDAVEAAVRESQAVVVRRRGGALEVARVPAIS
ncbi:prephenate dehydrogenase/arogenate dehydrogenase family protein [Nocardioides sp.]|uniref:prephenate dehydrogenase n=2 Tax=Nocardioides sp. TaxID=35761 RepID=UPI00321B0D00